MKIIATKCYLVQIVDNDDNEITYEYVFTNSKKDAIEYGKKYLFHSSDVEEYNNK